MLVASASGVAQSRLNKDFRRPDVSLVERKKRSSEAGAAAAASTMDSRPGLFHRIDERLRTSLLGRQVTDD